MTTIEIKSAQISFWSLAVEQFYIVNHGMTKEEMIKNFAIDLQKNDWRKKEPQKYIASAKREVEKMAGEISQRKYGGIRFDARKAEEWTPVIEKLRKSGIDNHFRIRNGKVIFSVNTFECSANIELAPLMLKRWKSYKVN